MLNEHSRSRVFIQPRSSAIVKSDVVKVSFLIGKANLFLGFKARDVVFPIQSVERLYIAMPNHVIQIRNLNELRGNVKIDTCQKALSFVRLRTSPRTFHAFISSGRLPELEVISRREVNSTYLYGDRIYLSSAMHAPSGYAGIVSDEHARCLRLQPALCVRTDHGYRIERTMFSEHRQSREASFNRVFERVGYDGRYKVDGRMSLRYPHVTGVSWQTPKSE